jgi:hypothetical protein
MLVQESGEERIVIIARSSGQTRGFVDFLFTELSFSELSFTGLSVYSPVPGFPLSIASQFSPGD